MPATVILVLTLLLLPRGPALVAPPPQPVKGDPTRDALALGRTPDDALLEAFNRGYGLSPSGTIEQAELITEFRRAVLIVRDHALQGDYGFGAGDLAKALAPQKGLVTFVVQVRLHPFTTFIKEPPYDLYVSSGPRTPPIASKVVKRDPVYPPGAVPGSAVVAVRLEASFPRIDIERAGAPALIVTDEKAEILWQARIDLTRYR
jgi:hypothetical protein